MRVQNAYISAGIRYIQRPTLGANETAEGSNAGLSWSGSARACPPVTPQNRPRKRGVEGSNPSVGSKESPGSRGLTCIGNRQPT
jgi:hypothetical protein